MARVTPPKVSAENPETETLVDATELPTDESAPISDAALEPESQQNPDATA